MYIKYTVFFVKIFIAFLSSLKELTKNQDCFLQIFARALITVARFKAYAFRNYKKIYGAESFSTNYGISRLFFNHAHKIPPLDHYWPMKQCLFPNILLCFENSSHMMKPSMTRFPQWSYLSRFSE